jgi:hypothetical protein
MTDRVQQILAKQKKFCSGCGTYYPTHGRHRDDCTAVQQGE